MAVGVAAAARAAGATTAGNNHVLCRAALETLALCVVVFVFYVVLDVVVAAVKGGGSEFEGCAHAVAAERLLDIGVVGDRSEQSLVDGFAGIDLLDDAEDAVVEMLVKVLRVGKGHAAG